jgi:predicted nucleic acid-binding protein
LLIFNAIEQKQFSAYILDITILNIDYIASKQTRDVRDFLKLINKEFIVIGASNTMITEALNIENNDLEDNLQYISAKTFKCDCIITNDKKFLKKDIQVVSSKAFIQANL